MSRLKNMSGRPECPPSIYKHGRLRNKKEQEEANKIWMERNSDFPCVCGANNFEDAADKCDGNGDADVCCAKYMRENYLDT